MTFGPFQTQVQDFLNQTVSINLDSAIDPHPLIVTPDTPLLEVLSNMSRRPLDQSQFLPEQQLTQPDQEPTSVALVMDNEALVGILTERDVVRLAALNTPLDVPASEVMSTAVITLQQSEYQDLFTVLNLFRCHRIRHLPVLDEQDHLMGVISQDSLRHELTMLHLLKLRQVQDVMIAEVICAPATASVLHLAQLMMAYRVSCVVITESQPCSATPDAAIAEYPIGMVTERDIVQFQTLQLDLATTPAQAVMSTPLFCLHPEDSLWMAHQAMQQRRVRRSVVIGPQGELAGIVTQSSILGAMSSAELYSMIAGLQQLVEKTSTQLSQEAIQRQQLTQALAESEARRQVSETSLQEVLNTAQAAIGRLRLFADRHWQMDYYSPGCEVVYSYTAQELLADPDLWRSRVLPEDYEQVILPSLEEMLAQRAITIEYRFRHRDGTWHWVYEALTSEWDPAQNHWLMTTVGIDITARKQTEMALCRREQQQAAIARLSQSALADVSLPNLMQEAAEVVAQALQAEYSSVLKAASEHEGLCFEAGVGWQAQATPAGMPPDEGAQARYAFLIRDAIITPDFLTEDRFDASSLLQADIFSGISVIIPDRNQPFGVLSAYAKHQAAFTADDMTFLQAIANVIAAAVDGQRTKQALQASETIFRQLMDNIPSLFWMQKADYSQLLYLSPAYADIWGQPPEIASEDNSSWLNSVHPADRDRVNHCIQQQLQGIYQPIEYRLYHPDGQIRWIYDRSFPILNEQGEVYRICGLADDITERKQLQLALQDSEAKLNDILNNASAAIASFQFFADHTIQYDYFSAGCEAVFGYTSDEMLNGIWLSRVPSDERESMIMTVRDAILAGGRTRFEYRFQHRDGSLRWITSSLYSRRDDARDCWVVVAVDTDITERKQVEELLRQSEERFRQITETINQVFLVRSATSGEFLYISPAYETIWGRSCDTLYQDPYSWLEQIHPGDRDLLDQSLTDQAQGQPVKREYRIIRPDGETRWIKAQIFPVWQAGKLARYVGLAEDVTERRYTEEALRHSENRFRTMFAEAPIGMALITPNGRITQVNQALCQTLNYDEVTLTSLHIQEIVHPDDFAQESIFIQQLFNHEIPSYKLEERLLKPSGDPVWMNLTAGVLQDPEGNILYRLCMYENITDQRAIEQMKNNFVSVVSHELRTPLTAIRGSLALLTTGQLGELMPEGQELLAIAASESQRLVRLVSDILDLERIRLGTITLLKEACDVPQLIAQAVDSVRSTAQAAGIWIEVAATDHRVWADGDRIVQILINLLNNAIKFSPPNTTVSISARQVTSRTGLPANLRAASSIDPTQPHILFQVTDRGRGIPADKLQTIFEPFEQVDASDARQKGGTGLGLAICRSIVEQHGGQIWAMSIPSQGSTFYFTLPQYLPEASC